MPSQALTPEFLETLPSLTPEARGTYYFDTEITGFAVEHRANGRATYYYRYRDAGKRVRLARIGAVDEISLIEARVLASRMKKMVAEGGDPKLEADRFKWPKDAEVAVLSVEQLHWLLAGIDLAAMRPHPERKYSQVG